jgi:antitoxin component of MazEF toxin-antitoxin module
MAITTRITTSGNSKAIRLPRALLDLSRIGDVVELEARPGEIVIRSAGNPRAGWSQQIESLLAKHGDPSAEFAELFAPDGLDALPWDGPSYDEWSTRAGD